MAELRLEKYGTAEICRMAGISQRQLEYWVLIGIVTPSFEPHGQRYFKRFTEADVEILKRVKQLTDEGFLVSRALERIKRESPELFGEEPL